MSQLESMEESSHAKLSVTLPAVNMKPHIWTHKKKSGLIETPCTHHQRSFMCVRAHVSELQQELPSLSSAYVRHHMHIMVWQKKKHSSDENTRSSSTISFYSFLLVTHQSTMQLFLAHLWSCEIYSLYGNKHTIFHSSPVSSFSSVS